MSISTGQHEVPSTDGPPGPEPNASAGAPRKRNVQEKLLEVIWRNPEVTTAELAAELGSKPEAVRRQLSRLRARKLIRRKWEIAPQARPIQHEWIVGISIDRSQFQSPAEAKGDEASEGRYPAQKALVHVLMDEVLPTCGLKGLHVQDVAILVGGPYDIALHLTAENEAIGDLVTGTLCGLRGIQDTHTFTIHYRASDRGWED